MPNLREQLAVSLEEKLRTVLMENVENRKEIEQKLIVFVTFYDLVKRETLEALLRTIPTTTPKLRGLTSAPALSGLPQRQMRADERTAEITEGAIIEDICLRFHGNLLQVFEQISDPQNFVLHARKLVEEIKKKIEKLAQGDFTKAFDEIPAIVQPASGGEVADIIPTDRMKKFALPLAEWLPGDISLPQSSPRKKVGDLLILQKIGSIYYFNPGRALYEELGWKDYAKICKKLDQDGFLDGVPINTSEIALLAAEGRITDHAALQAAASYEQPTTERMKTLYTRIDNIDFVDRSERGRVSTNPDTRIKNALGEKYPLFGHLVAVHEGEVVPLHPDKIYAVKNLQRKCYRAIELTVQRIFGNETLTEEEIAYYKDFRRGCTES